MIDPGRNKVSYADAAVDAQIRAELSSDRHCRRFSAWSRPSNCPSRRTLLC